MADWARPGGDDGGNAAGHRDGPVAAVVFDWGGVLTMPLAKGFAAWMAREGVDPAHFAAFLGDALAAPDAAATRVGGALPPRSPVHALEQGLLSPRDFEILLAADLTRRGSAVAPDGLLDRILADFTDLVPDMVDLVREVRSHGVRTAVLSNSWGEHYPDEYFAAQFDAVVVSGRVGLRKPQPEIFDLMARTLDLPAGRLVLVDDLAVNIDAAVAAGYQGVLHVDPATTRARLQPLLTGLAAPPPAGLPH